MFGRWTEGVAGRAAARPAAREAGGHLPDFRNLGVLLRAILLAELANFFVLFVVSDDLFAMLRGGNPLFEVSVLLVMLVLMLASPWLARLRYAQGLVAVIGLAMLIAGGLAEAASDWLGGGLVAGGLKPALIAGVLAALILGYFDWRERALSPALAQARLLALQARIRPHFLYNSINTAVSLLRVDPVVAERVLLDMADLFRALLADGRELVSFADELALARAYAEIEQLRLGERLRIDWRCEGIPDMVRLPRLVLQPLLENAVHHGIEPRADGGQVRVSAELRERALIIEVRNTLADAPVPQGNRMALANIEERLALYYDAEAQLHAGPQGGEFVVRLVLPLRKD